MVGVFVTVLLSLLGGTFAKKYVQYDALSQANFPPCGLLCYAADIVHCGLNRYDYYTHCVIPEFSMALRECSWYQCDKADHNQVSQFFGRDANLRLGQSYTHSAKIKASVS